jgi:hypothetical protein
MSQANEFDPRKSIEQIIKDMRNGVHANSLKDITEENLFDIILTCYEKGSNDTMRAMQSDVAAFDKASETADKLRNRLIAMNNQLISDEQKLNTPKE